MNARKEADLIHPETRQYLELDIFLPSLHLAFEYQVSYHALSSKLFNLQHHRINLIMLMWI